MDALFVPAVVVLLVAFGAVFVHALAGELSGRVDLAPIAAVAGLCALIVGIALLAGQPLASSYGYLQALGPAVGVALMLYALARRRSVNRQALSAAVFVGVGVILVSLFWATSEYADSRGRSEAKQLAHDILVNPSVTIFSKENLNIDALAPGAGTAGKGTHGACQALTVQKRRKGAYPYSYSGFTLLIRSGDRYFLTPTPANPKIPWKPELDSIFVIPDDGSVRVELARGADYAVNSVESTAKGQLAFDC